MIPVTLSAMLYFSVFLASIVFLGQNNTVKTKQLPLELGLSKVACKKSAC